MKKVILYLSIFCLHLFASCANTSSFTLKELDDSSYVPAANEILLNGKLPLQEQLNQNNKIYIVCSDLDLHGEAINIGAESTLHFAGGSICNGSITFNNTIIEGKPYFSNCNYSGTIKNSQVYLSWFNTENGKTDNHYIYEKPYPVKLHDTAMLQQIIDCCKNGATLFVDKLYCYKGSINIKKEITFYGEKDNEAMYGINFELDKIGFLNFASANAFNVQNGGKLSIIGIVVIGSPNLYISGRLYEKVLMDGTALKTPYNLSGLNIEIGGQIGSIYNSAFVGFTYGLKSNGGIMGEIINTYFSSCRFGFYAENTNNINCRGCRFNTNMLNFHFYEKGLNYTNTNKIPVKETDSNTICKIGAGLYLRNCSNVCVMNSRFEFNFIHAIIDEKAQDVVIDNCIFDTGTLCQVMINNQSESSYASLVPAMNNIVVSGSTFARGARCDIVHEQSKPGFSIFYITEKDNRGSNITIKNNIVTDAIEIDKTIDVVYQKNIFSIFNTSTTGSCLNVFGNSFSSSKAEKVYKITEGSSGKYNVTEKGNDYGTLTKVSESFPVLVFE